jgi:hypothetical protein
MIRMTSEELFDSLAIDCQLLFARSLFAETDDTIITEEVRKFPSRK